jgi:DNA-binding CsgD family transcriptional regulator
LPTRLINGALLHEARREDQFAAFGTVTDREYEVMLLVSTGVSDKQIARQLSICEGTVKVHLHNVYSKVAVSNQTALAALVRKNCDVFQKLRELDLKVEDYLARLAAVRSIEVGERDRASNQAISISVPPALER